MSAYLEELLLCCLHADHKPHPLQAASKCSSNGRNGRLWSCKRGSKTYVHHCTAHNSTAVGEQHKQCRMSVKCDASASSSVAAGMRTVRLMHPLLLLLEQLQPTLKQPHTTHVLCLNQTGTSLHSYVLAAMQIAYVVCLKTTNHISHHCMRRAHLACLAACPARLGCCQEAVQAVWA